MAKIEFALILQCFVDGALFEIHNFHAFVESVHKFLIQKIKQLKHD